VKRASWLLPLAFVVACSGKGNSGRKEIDPALIAQVPWVNGAGPLIDPNIQPAQAYIPPDPMFPAIGADQPDPGSRVQFDTDKHRAQACAALDGVVLSDWHLDFEPYRKATVGVAPFFAVYDDHTEGSFHTPEDAAFYPSFGAKRDSSIWGTAASQITGGPACDTLPASWGNKPNGWALHVRGGRFNYFGGGAEHTVGLDCPGADDPEIDPGQAEACNLMVDAVGDGRTDKAFDMTKVVRPDGIKYTGIAFWARRGPDSGSGLFVAFQDKYTSDRLARTTRLPDGTVSPGVGYCKRYRQCYPNCADGTECKPFQFADEAFPIARCVPPGIDPTSAMMEKALAQKLYPPCGAGSKPGDMPFIGGACTPPSYDPDIDFDNTQCKPYNFTGLDENYFCYGDTPPANPDERCGDGFLSSISLSTDWQFYKIPFSAFQQQGFGKKVPPSKWLPNKTDIPEAALQTIVFAFSVGNIDFYVDNLSFYADK